MLTFEFVAPQSIVRRIWGHSDTILFVFAGASAEFALNKAVDWLYFTGKLPSDPLGRLFSTVLYARRIVFAKEEAANNTIDQITHIHRAVEKNRGDVIPDWAYRDVLYMLIHYSIAAFEVLHRPLKDEEKDDVYDVFYRMGQRMQLKQLPSTYREWLIDRDRHMEADLIHSPLTDDLFQQYRKHLGGFRYRLLLEVQKTVVPDKVRRQLHFNKPGWIFGLLGIYKILRAMGLGWFAKSLLLPKEYKRQVRELDGHSKE